MTADHATRSPSARQVGAETIPETPRDAGELVDAIALELRGRGGGMPPALRETVIGALAVAAGQLARAEEAPRLSELSGRLEALSLVLAVYDAETGRKVGDVGAAVYGLALERWTP